MTDVAYRKQNDHAVITGAQPGSMVIAVPEEIEGLPVTEIAPHAFEGSTCPAFRLPGSIRRIGAYAFHGCQALEELALPENLQELGSYAFYDCHHLRGLSMTDSICNLDNNSFLGCDGLAKIVMEIREGRHQSLKTMLSELYQEVEVTFLYHSGEDGSPVQARVIFPEYFVEYVENAEARIFEEFTIGSGRVYRKFFREPLFDYDAYDSHFEIACLKDLAPQAGRVAVTRLLYPYELKETARARYLSWLKAHAQRACTQYVESGDLETLYFLQEQGVINEKNADAFLDQAAKGKNPGVLSWLMQIKHRHFQKQEKTFEL